MSIEQSPNVVGISVRDQYQADVRFINADLSQSRPYCRAVQTAIDQDVSSAELDQETTVGAMDPCRGFGRRSFGLIAMGGEQEIAYADLRRLLCRADCRTDKISGA